MESENKKVSMVQLKKELEDVRSELESTKNTLFEVNSNFHDLSLDYEKLKDTNLMLENYNRLLLELVNKNNLIDSLKKEIESLKSNI